MDHQQRAQLEQEAPNSPPGTKTIRLPIPFRPQPTTAEWFQDMWNQFAAVAGTVRPLAVPRLRPDGRPDTSSVIVYGPAGVPEFTPYTAIQENEPTSPPPTPYLETFFAFYDDYMRPMIGGAQLDRGSLATVQHRFRRVRELAFQTAFRAFSAYDRPPAMYLRRLFELRGPDRHASVVATFNFDVTIEQLANALGVAIHDGFASDPGTNEAPPAEWTSPDLENLLALWTAVVRNGLEFLGFEHAPPDANLLLKLHGSLGWYVLEEGGGDVGYRDELRHNAVYRHFRLPYEFLWRPDMERLLDQIASGGPEDPVTHTPTGSRTRKAGALWVRPYLVFARALKAHPDRLSLDVMTTFARLLEKAATILVVGYSWGDPHVNDLIFDAVARGASLANVSRIAMPTDILALWIHRFCSTFHLLRRRLFMFGGGAKQVLDEGIAELPSGQVANLDLVRSLASGLPTEWSLEQTLSDARG